MDNTPHVGSMKTKLSTPFLTETRDFYQEVFSMGIVEEWDSPGDRGVILEFRQGSREALLEIYHSDETFDFSGLSLQFRVEDVDDFVGSLDSVGCKRRSGRPTLGISISLPHRPKRGLGHCLFGWMVSNSAPEVDARRSRVGLTRSRPTDAFAPATTPVALFWISPGSKRCDTFSCHVIAEVDLHAI